MRQPEGVLAQVLRAVIAGASHSTSVAVRGILAGMTITLTPEQQKRLEAAVAAGQFPSVEEAVRLAVDRLMLDADDCGDLSWVKPYLEEARAEIARGETLSMEEVFAETDDWLKKRDA